MTFKDQLGTKTEQLENKILSLAPHYTNLEPWRRGILLIALTLFLLFSVYYLTSTGQSKKKALQERLAQEREREQEEKFLRQMAFFKKLQSG